jgi:hypothetical protein
MLTVKQLIAQLKKLDQSAFVAWRDHDQSTTEINAFVRAAEEAPTELLRDEYIVKVLTSRRRPQANVVLLTP